VYTLTAEPLLLVLLELQRHDAFVQERYKVYQAEKAAGVTGKWEISSDRLLRHQQRAYVLSDMAVLSEIMKICYDNPLSGYFGQRKTIALVRCNYYWLTLEEDIKKYVKGCDIY
jgi:hypothetical protein